MGMETTIAVHADSVDWIRLASAAARAGRMLTICMIDGQPAFPDEMPATAWNDVRVSMPGGMITMQRVSDGIRLVTWGNASPQLLADRSALAAILTELSETTASSS